MWEYQVGHVIDELRKLNEVSIQCVVTSPPYWGLRKYSGQQETIWGDTENCNHDWTQTGKIHKGGTVEDRTDFMAGRDQSSRNEARDIQTGSLCQKCGAWKGAFGLEPTIEMYVEHTVQVLREIWRVLRNDGVVFWNIGDSYNGSGGPGNQYDNKAKGAMKVAFEKYDNPNRNCPSLKPKDLCMIPFRVALAAQADGWWVRSDIVWSKPNPMPESVKDRPAKSHEYIFIFTKSKDYFWDAEAVRESQTGKAHSRGKGITPKDSKPGIGIKSNSSFNRAMANYTVVPGGRNLRSVWEIATQPYPEAHFATFPEAIPIRCILAGTSEKGRCPTCGKPWERIVKTVKRHLKREPAHCPKSEGSKVDSTGWTPPNPITIGWKPGCSCPRDDKLPPVPCVVLDPFAGSGTTLAVARSLGRHAIGIDISKHYKALAEKRAKLNVPDIIRKEW